MGRLAVGNRIIGTGKIAARSFHLDDTGTGIGQPRGGKRGRDRLVHGNHENAVQGPGHQYDLGRPSTCSAI